MSAKTCPSCLVERDLDSYSLSPELTEHAICDFCLESAPKAPPPEPKKRGRKPKEATQAPTPLPTPQPAQETPQKAAERPVERSPEMQAEADAAFAMPYVGPKFDKTAAASDPMREMAARELARRRLMPFVQRFRPKYMPGWVHKDICRRLERFVEAVERGEEPRLLLMMPPRAGKSELGSRHFAPWVLGKHPDWEIIAASHTGSLSLSFSRYIRDLLRDPAYQVLFPDTVLDASSQSVENWNLTKGGGYLAAGVGTGITGRGAHCLPLTERILTSEGEKTIYELIKGNEKAQYVLSYANGQLAYRRINAILTRKAKGVLTVTLDSGVSFKATGEHPVCVGFERPEGRPIYRRVDDLRAGESVVVFRSDAADQKACCVDEVPSVRDALHQEPVETAGAQGPVREADSHVLERVHGCDEDRAEDRNPGLRRLWRGLQLAALNLRSAVGAWKQASLLLKGVQRGVSFQGDCGRETPAVLQGGADLHAVQEAIPERVLRCAVVHDQAAVLQPELLSHLASWSPYREGYRSGFATILPARVQARETEDARREGAVCRVYVSGHAAASQGRGHREQRPAELGPSVLPLPQEASRQHSASIVVSVTYEEGEIEVGDLEVEGAHNFLLPSGNLLLNCLILDDLVKDQEAADSPTIRENTWEWYISTAHSRLAPGGGVLGIMTWWSEDDWAGRIQEAMKGDGEKFEIVRYPAINEEGDEYILPDDRIVEIPPGSPVPEGARMTRPHGTALHPERYTTEALKRKKRNYKAAGMTRMWNALYQQNPTPDSGIYFTKDLFRRYAHAPSRRGRTIYQAWDFAITEGEQNDYTVCATILQDEFDNLYVLDVFRFKSDDGNAIVEHMIDQYVMWDVDYLGMEDGQIWKAIRSQFERRCQERKVYPTFEVLVPLTDKLVRANPLKGRMQLGKVYFPEDSARPWVEPCVRELIVFPNGKHDDQCFVAGTMIQMADGSQKPIELVMVGDLVMSHLGPRRVLNSGLTNSEAEVVKVEFDGGSLTGTVDHPVWSTTRHAFVGLANLTNSDRLLPMQPHLLEEGSSWRGQQSLGSKLKSWFSMGRATEDTQTRRESTYLDTSVDLGASFIGTSGSSTTEKFQMGARSTTEMKIISTTIRRILSASPGRHMRPIATKHRLSTASLMRSLSILLESGARLLSGIARQKAWNGTNSMASAHGSVGCQTPLSAKSVVESLSRSSQPQGSAGRPAATNDGERTILATTRLNGPDAKQPVFNLEVEGAHTYFANGVLVHNCDALAWAVRMTLNHSAPRDPAPKPKGPESWKTRLAREMAGAGGGHMAS